MKRVLAALLALVLVLAMASPVLADDPTTGVTVTQGGGAIPVIKCKWETPDDHTAAGTQIDPPVSFIGTKEATIYVVVTDVEDHGDVAQVVADVFHPAGPPENGSMKYNNLEFSKLSWSEGMAAFAWANAHNVAWYSDAFNYGEVYDELNQGEAAVWSVCFTLHYCQPAGMYRVVVAAVDNHGNTSAPFSNAFEYVAVCGMEFDF